MENYKKLCAPPQWALKEIKGGRMNGKTDISPQWRYQAMTEVYGECGIGWKWELTKVWVETGKEGEVFVFSQVAVYTKQKDEWSAPIPGIGGDFLIKNESKGLYANDEAFKMATTDALGVALKFLGVGADIYTNQYGKHSNTIEDKAVNKKLTQKQIFLAAYEKVKSGKYKEQAIKIIDKWLTENSKELDLISEADSTKLIEIFKTTKWGAN